MFPGEEPTDCYLGDLLGQLAKVLAAKPQEIAAMNGRTLLDFLNLLE